MNKVNQSILILLSCLFIIAGCSKSKNATPEQSEQQTLTIEKQTLSVPLYFSGTISPIDKTNVVSPVEGIVEDIFFQYGHPVKKSDVLADVVSEKMESDFHSAISDYLKASDDYTNKKRKYDGSQELHRLEFISDNEFFTDKTALEESYFSMQQSRVRLRNTLKKIDINEDIEKLNLRDPKIADKLLLTSQNRIRILAPTAGVALYPEKAGEDASKDAIYKGSEVKQGQAMLSIGDLSGLSVRIEVNEVDVNQIKPQQKVTITGPAFPGIVLHGEVSSIDAQAKSSNSSAIPTFPVTISVNQLTSEQRDIIHVGMSAKVEILLEEPDVILVPIKAVQRKGNKSLVNKKDAQSEHILETPVKTGKTTLDSIIILQGLQPGDIIVYDN